MVTAEQELQNGLAMQRAGNRVEARRCYERALAMKPESLEACCNLAMLLHAEGKHQQAIAFYRRALALRPNFPEVQCNLGNALQATNDLPGAIAAYREALRLKPDFPEVHNSLGVALKASGELEGAIASYRAAIALKSGYLSAHTNLALALRAHGKTDEAIAASQKALAIDPRHVPALLTLGGAYEEARRLEDALGTYRQILLIDPKHAGARCNIGVVLQAQDKLDEAMVAYREALELDPNNVEALTNLGTAYQALNNIEAALAHYQRAIALRPESAQAHFNEAVCQLLAGNFEVGWAKYEYRWQAEQRKFRRAFTQPLWQGGRSLAGQTILVYPEQGLGDTLQFVRYVPLLAAQGAKVILEVQPPLRALMDSFPGASTVIARGEPLPPFDVHCPLLSLPLAFDTRIETIPANVPYLRAPASNLTRWRIRFESDQSRKIGVVWSGGPHHKTDRLRSIPLEQFRAIVRDVPAHFFCLQKEVKESDAALLSTTPEIVSLASEIRDFADTAAIIEQLDLIISVDTSVAHLAGALGKPAWILLPFAPDWRWMLNRTDSPWYPTARLFRQPRFGDWKTVMDTVHAALVSWAS